MPRLALCCLFRDEPIKFRTTTAKAVSALTRPAALDKLAALCRRNADALQAALAFCAANGIGAFRVNSQVLPLKTHPGCGYAIEELPGSAGIVDAFEACGRFAAGAGVRLSFHPDQFVVLNSPRPEVVESSIAELEYQAQVAGWIGADAVNIHGGGAYGDKSAALERFVRTLERLSDGARRLLTVENDDTTYTPSDLLPLCQYHGVPLVYDVHHHRCNPDGLTVEEATLQAAATWDREPLFHVSSPLNGWDGPHPRRHHDFIHIEDFPACWREMDLTVDVEAKAKEVAVLTLMRALEQRWHVYLARCSDGSLYTGIATDVQRRLAQHNAGKGARYTRSRRPVTLGYAEKQPSHSAALKREWTLKGLPRPQKEALVKNWDGQL